MASREQGAGAARGPGVRKPPRKGLLEKRQAIERGARTVFGREGYTGASVDAIAAEAGVSTRTIYNHFTDKEELFREVFLASAASVTADSTDLFARHFRHFGRAVDVEADLLALGREWVGQNSKHPEHFALVRQIITEGPRMPADVIEEWQRVGPQTVRADLAERLRELADQGLFDIDDADAAARHLSLLIGGITLESFFGAVRLSAAQVEKFVASGVWAFLKLYGPS
ncbi:TetR/AcrR family transcriptional regulator [Streptomyces scopuliridis]|uniref:TetR/AcrR family transcriptional regulator n=1 Tax=Streptomyces scopuliridis TaxID=452529 RepID=A0ACD4ZM63_9ACTN|nr:TetR/AcrR family transcriptional regulator [Streptomyces scopuliridis]WSB99283.1 TetR/AcrR family transcriptional regulator [Streptomyces scopuliridis]WSC07016.1 TetR/AcrR family transcriptional regulator [Streptomyces scopuliridis]